MLWIDVRWKRFPLNVEWLWKAVPHFSNPSLLFCTVELQNIIGLNTSTECTEFFQKIIQMVFNSDLVCLYVH